MSATTVQLSLPASGSPLAAALAELHRQGQHYLLLNSALDHLQREPSDEAVALLAVQSYIAVGLPGLARELLQKHLARHDAARELDARVARGASGRVSWHARAAAYERNVARLLERYPQLQRFQSDWESLPRRCELYQAADGNYHLARRGPNGRVWLPDLLDAQGLVAALQPPIEHSTGCGPFVLLDDRFGRLFDLLFTRTEGVFLSYSPRIYLLEECPDLFGAALYVRDCVANLCQARSAVFVGPSAHAEFIDWLAAHPERPPPTRVLALPRGGVGRAGPVVAALNELARQRQARARDAIARVNAAYAAETRAAWARRFAAPGPTPLRVLGLTSRFTSYLQYSMRDLGAAFVARGCQFELFMEASDFDISPPDVISAAVERFRPDLIVCIDNPRRGFLPRGVPFVNWIQDLLPQLLTAEAGAAIGPLDFYVAPVRTHFEAHGYPPAQGLIWPMATSATTYHPAPLTPADQQRYAADFAYVSHQSASPEAFVNRCLRDYRPTAELARLMHALYLEMLDEAARDPLRIASRPAAEILERTRQRRGLHLTDPAAFDFLAHGFIHPLGELLYRHAALEQVADYCDRRGATLALYGRGWDEHPRFGRYARGVAENGEELRKTYLAAKINLQITSYGAVHQRLLDGLACGGFFLLRPSPFDWLHESAARVISAVTQEQPAADADLPRTQYPALAAALDELAERLDRPRPGDRLRIESSELAYYRELLEADCPRTIGAAFGPQIRSLMFHSPEELAALADRYLEDAEARAAQVAPLREIVLKQYTYGAFVDALLRFLTQRLAADDSASQSA